MTSNVGQRGLAVTRMRGFTLVELMIVLAIIAILAAIALPTYGRYAYRAHRVDGQEMLLRIANAQERFYATNNYYGSLNDIGYTSVESEKGYYLAKTDVADGSTAAQAYTATVTPQNAQVKDVCGELTINSAGVKKPGPNDTSFNTNGSCW
ncbi:MAG: type IV pilin protein [Rhodanobacter sp.]